MLQFGFCVKCKSRQMHLRQLKFILTGIIKGDGGGAEKCYYIIMSSCNFHIIFVLIRREENVESSLHFEAFNEMTCVQERVQSVFWVETILQ